jgi:hypothetical protein
LAGSLAASVCLIMMSACSGSGTQPAIQDRQSGSGRVAGPASIGPEQACEEEVTVVRASRISGIEILLPQDPLAEGTGLGVRLCPGPEVMITYRSGVAVSEARNTLDDPEAEWKGLAKEYPEFSMGSTHGVSASLADPEEGAIGGVQFVLDGGRYMVIGNGEIPLDELIRVADSLAPAST